MTNEQKLREFAEKWGFSQDKTDEGFLIDNDRTKECLSDLTALISEHYVSKEEYNRVVRQLQSQNPFPGRPNPRDVNPYDSRAIKRSRKK